MNPASWQRQIHHPEAWGRGWLERRHRELVRAVLACDFPPPALEAELWCVENYLNKHTRPGRTDID